MKGKRYSTAGNVQAAVTTTLNFISQIGIKQSFNDLIDCTKRCIEAEGDYIDCNKWSK